MSDSDISEEFLANNGITPLLSNDQNYPKKLSIVKQKNHKIFHIGNIVNYENCVSVVGSRSCSEFGKEFAFNLAKKLVENNFTIVSGLAHGIDTHAHHGCVESNGVGIAIMAWFHKIYPPQNKSLFDQILENGCGFSENLLEPEKNSRYEFLNRDKLIAALSNIVIVVESKSKGGAKYTADYATEKNIPVIKCKTETNDSDLIEGHKMFLANGAREATSPEHVIELISELKEKKDIKNKKNLDYFIQS